jgi:lipoic acid synthetase
VTGVPRLPAWLTRPLSDPAKTRKVRRALTDHGLNTVCDEARCPNRAECFGRGTATFMILGAACTRECAFCAVGHGDPDPPDPEEPARVATAARALGLRYVVVTSVTRDDLDDGGAAHFVEAVESLRREIPGAGIELLVPDFLGDARALDRVLEARPDVLGHNVETVRRLYPAVRSGAGYERSLRVLRRAADSGLVGHVKSALMLGLGETRDEIEETLGDLAGAGVGIVCMGQYLRPSPDHAPVERFVPPGEFDDLRRRALAAGFGRVVAGPFVRSSYRAEDGHVERASADTRR